MTGDLRLDAFREEEKGLEAAVRGVEGTCPIETGLHSEKKTAPLRKAPGKMVPSGRARWGMLTGRKRKEYSVMRSGSRRFCQVLEGPGWGLGISEAWQ